MSHDPPLEKLHREDPNYYSQLEDVLQVLKEVEPVSTVAKQEHVQIALCFKGAPSDICRRPHTQTHTQQQYGRHETRAAAARWLQKVDSFFHAANRVVKEEGLQVEFILDGDGLPLDCLAQRWRPWSSVWMNGSAPQDAFLSDAIKEGFDRFRVLNEPTDLDHWQHLAEVNYGKFSAGLYPYQIWEPGNQEVIQNHVDIYRSGPPHPPGLDFATNADVAMFQVYSGLGLNQELMAGEAEKQEEQDGGGGHGGLITIVRPGLALILPDRRKGEYRVFLYNASEPLSSLGGNILEESLLPLQPSSTTTTTNVLPGFGAAATTLLIQTFQASSAEKKDEEVSLLVATQQGDFFLYGIPPAGEGEEGEEGDTHPPQLILREARSSGHGHSMSSSTVATDKRALRKEETNRTEKSGNEHMSFSSALLLLSSKGRLMELYVDKTRKQEGCRLAYQVLQIGSQRREGLVEAEEEEDKEERLLMQRDNCLWWGQAEEEGQEFVTSAVAVPVLHEGHEIVLVFFASSDAKIYLSAIPSTLLRRSYRVVQIGVGTEVAASAAATPASAGGHNRRNEGEPMVMLVAGNGFCYNSHLHNTGPFNICKLVPYSTPGVLDYTYGTTSQWLQVLRRQSEAEGREDSARKTKVSLVTPCDEDLLHGSYDLGFHPSVALFSKTRYDVHMLELHNGFPSDCPDQPRIISERGTQEEGETLRRQRACECGPSLLRSRNSLVVDSFPLSG